MMQKAGMRNGILNLVFNRLCVVNERRWYGRKTGHYYKPNIGLRKTIQMLRDGNGMNDFDSDDEDYDAKLFHAHKTYDDHMMEQEKRRKTTAFKIIERKYIKQAKEPNLLTWAAKQQLKYLNELDPELWTPAKLAESFPISEEGVKKLLKNNFRPENEQRLIRHDKSVLEKWKKLKAGQGPISTAFKHVNKSIIMNFENMDGNNRLPMPNLETKWDCQQVQAGEFEDLIKTHKELTKKARENIDNNISEHKEENSIHHDQLQQLTNNGKKSSKWMSFEEFKQSMRKQLLQPSFKNNLEMSQKYIDLMTKDDDDCSKKSPVSVVASDSSSNNNDIKDFFAGKVKKYKDPQTPSIKWDVHRDTATPQGKEAYLYEEQTGYQRPYGKYCEFQNINIPQELRQPNCLYRKGDCYYDENGQLLYRVPFSGNRDE